MIDFHYFKLSRKVAVALIAGFAVLLIIRLALPSVVLWFVNKQLNQIPHYHSQIEEVDIHLWRGAYDIRGLKIVKTGGKTEQPFVEIPEIQLSVEWRSLFYGKCVGEIVLQQPKLTFINSSKAADSQLSFSKEWKEQGEKIFPFELNRLVIEKGLVVYQDLHAQPAISLTIREFHLMALNIRNVQRASGKSLPAQITSQGIVFESGKFNFEAQADLNQEPEDFAVKFKLVGVDLTQLNDFFRYYGKFDVTRGTFQMFSEVRAHDGKFEGYIKPLLENVQVMGASKENQNIFLMAWETAVAGVMELFKNHPKDRLATVIPLSGTLQDPKIGFWIPLGNLLKNAFIKAFEPQLEQRISSEVSKESK